tara:strand:+ start:465 stop:830 length:366 start_codon:yes stop_codon:yes gene_type:complete
MAVNAKPVPSPLATTQTTDSDADEVIQYAVAGSGNVASVYVDNTNNGARSFVKVYDATSGVTVGTTAPLAIFMAPASAARMYTIPLGLAFGTGLAYAVVTTAGTAGTTGPGSTVTLRFLTN